MPNIPVYVTDEEYGKFKGMKPETQKEVKEAFKKEITKRSK